MHARRSEWQQPAEDVRRENSRPVFHPSLAPVDVETTLQVPPIDRSFVLHDEVRLEGEKSGEVDSEDEAENRQKVKPSQCKGTDGHDQHGKAGVQEELPIVFRIHETNTCADP